VTIQLCMTTVTLTAQQRLEASRQAIVRDMNHEDPSNDGPESESNPEDIAESGVDASSGSWDLIRQVARSWWQSHPARLALDVGTPLLQGYAEKQPVKLLGIAAATGAAVVLLRPWRLISLTGLALALIKSSEVSGVMRSLMHGDRPQRHR
jgi:hypothetical protein